MAIFAISALIYMLGFGHKKQLANPRLWAMAVLSLLILSPNIYWNYQHDFPTFSHTASYVDRQGLYPGEMFSFLLDQAAIIGPIGYILMCLPMLVIGVLFSVLKCCSVSSVYIVQFAFL